MDIDKILENIEDFIGNLLGLSSYEMGEIFMTLWILFLIVIFIILPIFLIKKFIEFFEKL